MGMVKLTPKDFDIENECEYVETAEIYEIGDEMSSIYGMTCAVVDDEDIEALQSGKILYFAVEDEYSIAIRKVDI